MRLNFFVLLVSNFCPFQLYKQFLRLMHVISHLHWRWVYVRLFNSFPGQPVETLISLIPHFHLSNDTVLDLSNKGLLGNVTAQILQAMWENQVPIRRLNLSGNAINWPEDIEALLPQLTSIEALDLSNNNFGFDSTTRTAFETFARGLSYLTQLRELHLSSNAIDNGIINNATQIFGEHLRD